MSIQLIADHIQHEREVEVAHARLERLVRDSGQPRTTRLRIAAARRLIELGLALGGDAVRPGRTGRVPTRPVV